MQRIVIAALIAASSVVGSPLASSAAETPAAHAGDFYKNTTQTRCIRFAKDALRREHYNLWYDSPYTVLANDNEVTVQVVCAARSDGTVYAVVSAFSSDSKTAELARNVVRKYIVDAIVAEG